MTNYNIHLEQTRSLKSIGHDPVWLAAALKYDLHAQWQKHLRAEWSALTQLAISRGEHK